MFLSRFEQNQAPFILGPISEPDGGLLFGERDFDRFCGRQVTYSCDCDRGGPRGPN